MKCLPLAFVACAVTATFAFAADPIRHSGSPQSSQIATIAGRASVLDGRTIWFPQAAQKIRLADIDTCELPQWALNPEWNNRKSVKAPSPVPCGPFAKAWLKRSLGAHVAHCNVVSIGADGTPEAVCTAQGRDLAREMLRVGWARISTPYPSQSDYVSFQTSAMAARYGMWATYVLDMDEWRRRAVDRTNDRQPIADLNLLATRQNEISPPFADAKNKPRRTDR